MAFFEGLMYGLAMVLFIGPVFFTLLKASLDHGFKGGLTVALGIIFSDIVAILICMAGAIAFFKNEGNQFYIAIAAGVILVVLGLKYILSPKMYNEENAKMRTKEVASLFSSGFIVNFVNPFVFLVWIALIVNGEARFGAGLGLWLYLSGVLCGILGTDLLKAFFAHKLQRFVDPVILKKVYLVIGVGMVAFGIRAFFLSSTM